MAEQWYRKPQVVGSSPTDGSSGPKVLRALARMYSIPTIGSVVGRD